MKFTAFLEQVEQFEVPDRKDPSKTVTINRYVLDPKAEPTAVIFGKFNPWTGPKGHGRLVTAAKKKFGIANLAIASPEKMDKDLFTREQKNELIDRETNITPLIVKSSIPIRMFTDLLSQGVERPVLFIGQDREKDFSRFLIPYSKNNQRVTDMSDKNFGKGEYIVSPRNQTSATLVRKALLDGDDAKFLELTGYEQGTLDRMKEMLRENGYEV